MGSAQVENPDEDLASRLSCEAFGHHASEDSFSVYPDGLIAAKCIRCSKRMTMDRLPGGIPYLRIRQLVESLMDGDPSIYSMSQLGEMADWLRAERARLDEAESLLALARRMLDVE